MFFYGVLLVFFPYLLQIYREGGAIMKNYHEVLGLKPDAEKEEIRRAYRKLAFEYHPDRNPAPDAEERFVEITEAYEQLMWGHASYGEQIEAAFQQVADALRQMEHQQEEMRLRREEIRERARAYARMQYETFRQNNEAFRKSWYFYPAMALAYSLLVLDLAVAVFLLIGPVVTLVLYAKFWPFIALALFISWFFSFRLFWLAREYREEISPYFRNYSA